MVRRMLNQFVSWQWTLFVLTVGFSTSFPCCTQGAEEVQFNRSVRPILAKHCFACHGLDEESREAELRLDQREAALAELDSGSRAIVPGSAEESELITRISSEDPDLRMPPADGHEALTAEEIALLSRWINQGADYELHWSLAPPEKVSPPKASLNTKIASPIDAFVMSRLQEVGLKPAPAAEKHTLVRRLSLDLTGLPPTPSEINDFVADQRPDAYARLVDRLLASPHHGERLAVAWLDAARYADTHGYHIDSHRDMWPWRDWVIKAYNENLPFDVFTTWQLAGDLLPNATVEQQVASGFNRNHGINYEGGAIPEEYLVEYVVDRVNTTSTVWMGLTMGCARCHDHKYDPLSQEEYFKFFAFFNTIDEKGLDGQRGNAVPLLALPSESQKHRQETLTNEIKRLEKELVTELKQLDADQVEWEAALANESPTTKSRGLRDSQWFEIGPFSEETAAKVLTTDYLKPPELGDLQQTVVVQGKERSWSAKPDLVDGQTTAIGNSRSATYLRRTITVDSPRTVTVSVGCTDALQLWVNGKLLMSRDESRPLPERQQEFEIELQPGENHFLAKVVNISWGCEFYFALRGLPESTPNAIAKIVKQAKADRSDQDAKLLQNFYRESISSHEKFQTLRHDVLAYKRELNELSESITTTMVMREQSKPRKTFRLGRGQYDSPQEEVKATTPSVLPPLPTSGTINRLTLARWITSPSHPLTSRVAVNRLWQMLFGVGIVETSEDFGTQGEWPSHPELLDWLAVEFVESGWDVRHMLRLMVMSSTYRQSSAATPEKLVHDPYNRLLSRGPRFRLQAEFIRDVALVASGLLNDDIGGPSVKTYQPPGMWLELAHQKDNSQFTAQEFVQSTGPDLYRRGLYTFWKRSVPPPTLVTFDAPNRETCVVRRETTNTPLQALVLLNDPEYIEASRALAGRMMKEAPSSAEDRARRGFLLAVSRQPTAQELEILLAKYEWHLAEFKSDNEAAEKLLSVGDSQRDTTLPVADHAAWTCVASMILNLDETITKE